MEEMIRVVLAAGIFTKAGIVMAKIALDRLMPELVKLTGDSSFKNVPQYLEPMYLIDKTKKVLREMNRLGRPRRDHIPPGNRSEALH